MEMSGWRLGIGRGPEETMDDVPDHLETCRESYPRHAPGHSERHEGAPQANLFILLASTIPRVENSVAVVG